MAIRCFGHYWSKDAIDWGRPGTGGAGRLLGWAGESTVDFRDQIAVYALFNEDRRVIYAGQTGASDQRLFHRLRQHARGPLSDRWSHFSWFGMRDTTAKGTLSEKQKPDSKSSRSNAEMLDVVEAVLIQLLEPDLNKQGPKWKAFSAIEFEQYIPWEEEPEKHKAPLSPSEERISNDIAALRDAVERLEKQLSSLK